MRMAELNFRALLDYYEIVVAKDNGMKGQILCQFHEDHRPSCNIDFTKNLYYCFACSQGGSIVNFVMGKEGLEYPQAVEWLSSFFGDKLEVAGVDYHSALKQEAVELAKNEWVWLQNQFVLDHLPLVKAKLPTEKDQRADLEERIYKQLVKLKYENVDREKFPDKWFWNDMASDIEDYLWIVECAWKDRLPWEKIALMSQATEETFFDHWDEEVDSFATEKMLLKEVTRITERLLWRTKDMLTGDSKRLAGQAKRMMIGWLGLLKALSLDGKLLPKAHLISETGCEYGWTA